jgi:hypothetical protein
MTRRPVVEIVEFTACGVSINWSTPAGRTLALKAIVDVAAPFLGMAAIDRIRPADEQEVGHWHLSVFHGPNERYASGLVLHSAQGGWELRDEVGEVGPADTSYGVFPSPAAACREGLRLLRERFGAPMWPCWDSGPLGRGLRELGYSRGRVRWRWWPPGLQVVGGSLVSPTGDPEPASPVDERTRGA